jgi:rsbT co-antagonist protein RsbR
MQISAIHRVHAQVADEVSERLCKRSASAFRRVGKDICRGYAEAAITALERDLSSGKREAVRATVYALIEELADAGLTFADLRFYAQTLRSHVRDALELELANELAGRASDTADPEPGDLRLQVEDWFFELIVVCTMRFMAWRDEKSQRETAKLGVERLETQLAELKVALDEKTELLELIRQASTPIVPVVSGILVVPLVGTFDTFRAELLTEKLLNEIARQRAKAAILDISGVPVFDTAAAQLIIRLARSVRLLGAAVFLVGMSPATARTIVDLGVDLSGLATLATLQDGLAQALVMQSMKIIRLK